MGLFLVYYHVSIVFHVLDLNQNKHILIIIKIV
jgi:hypothetical protein